MHGWRRRREPCGLEETIDASAAEFASWLLLQKRCDHGQANGRFVPQAGFLFLLLNLNYGLERFAVPFSSIIKLLSVIFWPGDIRGLAVN